MATQSGPILYAVTATLPDEATLSDYVDWLNHGHIQDVVGAGAAHAQVIAIDPEPQNTGFTSFRVETRYTFPTRAALQTYIRDHAPGLRAQGVALFAHRGVTFQRTIGLVVAAFAESSRVPGERV